MDKKPIEEKIVFALVPGTSNDSGKPIIMVGVPKAAWDYMKDGKTHNFDMSNMGIPVQFILYGAEDHAAAMKVIEEGAKAQGVAIIDKRREDDFTIKGQEPEKQG